jgi:hypothetical protein
MPCLTMGRQSWEGELRDPLTPGREPLLQIPPGADRPAHPICIAASAAPEAASIALMPLLHHDDRRHVGGVENLLHVPSIGRSRWNDSAR